MQVSGAPENALGLEVNELPFLLFCRQGQERQQRQQGKQTLEVSWAVRGVLLEGGGSLSRLSFPFLSETGGRPFRAANFHARGARHSPQQSATADEPSGACPLVPLQLLGRNRLCRGGSPLLALGLGLWVPLRNCGSNWGSRPQRSATAASNSCRGPLVASRGCQSQDWKNRAA